MRQPKPWYLAARKSANYISITTSRNHMTIDDRLLFCGTLKELNRKKAWGSNRYGYVIGGKKVSKQYASNLANALLQFKNYLRENKYAGAVEFSCTALKNPERYSITAAPIRNA